MGARLDSQLTAGERVETPEHAEDSLRFSWFPERVVEPKKGNDYRN